MLFQTPEFLFVFLPITLGVFLLLGHYSLPRCALAWVSAASLFFYGWWNPTYLLLLLGSMAFNFPMGTLLRRRSHQRRILLIVGIVVNLGGIAYFKYANFFLESLQATMGIGEALHVLLPLGISFFTFEQISWLVENANGSSPSCTWLEYCVFITHFPKLIAGPIIRPHELLPQLSSASHFSAANLSVGITIFVLGLLKKVILADRMVPLVGPVFHAAALGHPVSLLEAWGATLAFTFQIYFDFSGYSDMALGLARMFGMILPVNFHAPYLSLSIGEFWARWHMSLSRFLRDYVYIPLGGSRAGVLLRYRNLLVTMLLSGLWHGAGWTYVLWGGLHGVYLMIYHAWRSWGWACTSRVGSLVSWAATMLSVVVAWVFFRAESVASAWHILLSMFYARGIHLPQALAHVVPWVPPGVRFDLASVLILPPEQWVRGVGWMCILTCSIFLLPTTQRYLHRERPILDNVQPKSPVIDIVWSPTALHALILATIAFICVIALLLSQETEFLYFQF